MITNNLTDEGLMQGLANGQDQMLNTFYDRYAATIYAFAMRMVWRGDIAEEIVQETFVRVWRAAPTYYTAQGGFKPWLFRITRNLCLDYLRRQRIRPKFQELIWSDTDDDRWLEGLSDASADVAETALDGLLYTEVRQALHAIPVAQRQALELAYFEGLTHREIAQRLNEPLGTVKTRLRLGLSNVAHLMEPN